MQKSYREIGLSKSLRLIPRSLGTPRLVPAVKCIPCGMFEFGRHFLRIRKNVCHGYLYIDVYIFTHYNQGASHSEIFYLVCCVVCFHPEVNVTVLRCLHDFGEEVYINYTYC